MMEQEVIQSFDFEIEEGELSDSSITDNDGVDVYTPLQRPVSLSSGSGYPSNAKSILNGSSLNIEPLHNCKQMEQAMDDEVGNGDSSADSSTDSSSGNSTDTCLKLCTVGNKSKLPRKKIRRTVMVRVEPMNDSQFKQRAHFKKYDIWAASLQEDALTENMRGIVMSKRMSVGYHVDNNSFSPKYSNRKSSQKRQFSNSNDDISDNEQHQLAKRCRSTCGSNGFESFPRKVARNRFNSNRSRAAHRRRGSSPTSGSDTNICESRNMLDLSELEGRDPLDVAREIANKLHEKCDELLVRIVEVLGVDLPVQIYKETQRIEADGGILIKTGERRRTPGGVFLLLLKEDGRLTAEERKQIFSHYQKNRNKKQKELKAMSRDRKVEELKKRLNKQKELPVLNTRKDHFHLSSELSLEIQPANLSNPPPSPVGQEHSPDYKVHAINHVRTEPTTPEKPSTSASALAALSVSSNDLVNNDDDFLDINCGEMDFF